MRKRFGWLVATGFALGLPAAALGQSPHDIGGVGAMGLIGRGVIREERPSAVGPGAAAYTPVYVAVPVAVPTTVPNRPVAASPASTARGGASAPVGRPEPRQPARVRNHPYMGFDRGWLRGYWSVPDGRAGGSRGGPRGATRGAGWGLASWFIGPMIYRWGYFGYHNPFLDGSHASGDGPGAIHDDSRPIDVVAPPPAEARLYDGLRGIGEARAAFQREDYSQALRELDEAAKRIPDSPSLHYLRGLTLVALHRYREAAADFHAVIAVVPGWDWATTAKLYHNPETYTRQLRMLETYTEQHPRLALAHFLLAIQYLTTGYADAALTQFRQAAALRPDDELTARLIRELQSPGMGSPAGPPMPEGKAGTLEGNWTARPREGTTITLTIRAHGHITWAIAQGGQVRRYEGFGLQEDGVLSLTDDPYNTMTGRIRWRDANHFTFRVLDDRSAEPGLSFARIP